MRPNEEIAAFKKELAEMNERVSKANYNIINLLAMLEQKHILSPEEIAIIEENTATLMRDDKDEEEREFFTKLEDGFKE